VITNETDRSTRLVIKHRRAGDATVTVAPTDMKWPQDTYSLSHIALPMPVTDPLYGHQSSEESPGINLGKLALYGERGLLRVPASDMLRQRWNPFYAYLEERVRDFMGLDADAVR
jgi:hypothetical protein